MWVVEERAVNVAANVEERVEAEAAVIVAETVAEPALEAEARVVALQEVMVNEAMLRMAHDVDSKTLRRALEL